jgi:ribosomal protein S17
MNMKRSVIAILCALVAPLAFAQTTTTQTTTTTHGTVTKYEHGKTIVVRTEKDENPISYALGKTVHYVNKAGRKIDEHLIKPGSRVIVYTAKGRLHDAERVVVDED